MRLNPVLPRCDVAAARKRPAVILTQVCYLPRKGGVRGDAGRRDGVEFCCCTDTANSHDELHFSGGGENRQALSAMFGYKVIEHEAHSLFRFVCMPQVIWRERSLHESGLSCCKTRGRNGRLTRQKCEMLHHTDIMTSTLANQ